MLKRSAHLRLWVTATVLAGLVAACESGPATFDGIVLVANAVSRDVAIFQGPSFKAAGRVQLPGSPQGLAVQPGGERAWVAIKDTNTVEVIDLAQLRILRSIRVCKAPADIGFSAEKALVVCDDGYSVAIDVRTLARVGGRTAIGFAPRTIEPGPRGHLWTANRGTNDLSEIDPAGNTLVDRFPAAPFAYGLAFTPDNRYAFVTSKGWNAVAVLRTEDMEILGSVEVPEDPAQVVISPDGARVYVASRTGQGVVSVINARTFQLIETVEQVGKDPESLALSPDGRLLFVAVHGGGALTIIDTDTYEVTRRLAGEGPIAVAVPAALI